jgi:hypothetical protein
MDEDGQFTFKKPEPKPEEPQAQAGGEQPIANNALAGSDLDQRDLDENMRNMAEGGSSTPQENPATTRNKPSVATGPDKRLTGLPQDAGNQNVDTRTETRVG